jgi:CheY-like chemotaxis protein
MSRIEQGHIDLHEEPIHAPKFLDSVTALIRPVADQKNITVDIDLSEAKTEWLIMDRVRTRQIFVNLLTNAIKFSDPGSTINWTIADTNKRPGHIVIKSTVTDHGCGMSKEFQEELFKPFSQEHNKFSSSVTGTGLGLAIVSNLVTHMGGTVSVDSRLGEGSTFTVSIPCETGSGDLAAEEKSKEADLSILSGKRVLLCEDNDLNSQIAKRLLEKKGMTVTCAFNGQDGLDLFKAEKAGAFDAVLMDIRMPVMDGLETTRAIRALDSTYAKSIPVIAMTANAFADDVDESLKAGMDYHLIKPIEPDLMYSTLAHYIHESETKKR